MLTVTIFFAVASAVCAVLSAATPKVPLWVAVVLTDVTLLLIVLPK